MTEIKLSSVCKDYGDNRVLSDVSLTIPSGVFVVFVGPSGCGKSTLLRAIAGLEEVSGGDILFGAKSVRNVPAAKRGVAMVFQSYALYPHMTVAENMTFSLRLAGVARAERRQRAMQVAETLRLTEYLDRKPGQLSGGQRQRVAIGRAIVRQPDVYLFDEPLSNLDAALRGEMRLEIARLHKLLGNTMIYVTHDQVEAMTMADRIVVMRDGAVAQVGTPLELYNRPANRFVAEFIGAPRMNFLDGTVTAQDEGQTTITTAGGVIALPRVAVEPGAPIAFGIRPEHLAISADGKIEGRVDVVERLGGEAHVHVNLADGHAVTVKCEGTVEVEADQQIRLTANLAHHHLFDRQGRALRHDSIS